MKRIPVGPLRAFDVAARNLNLSAAAEEMNVTHAAVSRQVKQLEERLGVKLFERLPRGLKLTAHGALLAEGTREAFDRLASALEDVSTPAVRRKLTISTFSSLVGALADAARAGRSPTLFPDVDLHVITSARLVDFAREDVDIAHPLRRRSLSGPARACRCSSRRKSSCASPALLKRGPPIKTFADLQGTHAAARRLAPRLDPLAGRGRRERRESRAAASSAAIATRCCKPTLEGQGVGIASEVFAAGELQPGGW